MSTGLIDVMKRATLQVTDDAKLADLRFGTVTSVNPLNVQLNNNLTLPSSVLIVADHLKDVEYTVNFDIPSNTISSTTEKSDDSQLEEPLTEHDHKFSVTTPQKTIETKLKISNALKVGDKVALLRSQGGQSYFILDRVQ